MLKPFVWEEGGAIPCYKVTSLAEYVDFVGSVSPPERTIFRGHRQDWPLLPVIARDRPFKYRSGDAEEIIRSFMRQARPWVDAATWNEWDWIVTARHHGVPTRLLDFTTNPLAALWFAVEESDSETRPCVVWAARYGERDAVEFGGSRGPFTRGDSTPCVYLPNHVTPRIVAQESVFVLIPPEYDGSGETTTYVPLNRRTSETLTFEKAVIEARFRVDLRNAVERCGIHYASMYPGLDGTAKAIERAARVQPPSIDPFAK